MRRFRYAFMYLMPIFSWFWFENISRTELAARGSAARGAALLQSHARGGGSDAPALRAVVRSHGFVPFQDLRRARDSNSR